MSDAVSSGQNTITAHTTLPSGVTMTSPTLSGLHHVTLSLTDLDGATTWFETVFGARRLAELDHHDEHGSRFAVVLRLSTPTRLSTRPPDRRPAKWCRRA
jgi:hypothetical protein